MVGEVNGTPRVTPGRKRAHQLTEAQRGLVLDTIERLGRENMSLEEVTRALGYGANTGSSVVLRLKETGGSMSRRVYVRMLEYRRSRGWPLELENGNGTGCRCHPQEEAPSRSGGDPLAWMDRVAELLLEAAIEIEEATKNAPRLLRDTYQALGLRVQSLMSEFQR